MSINAIPAFKDNYIWTIIHEQNHAVICVDPGEARPVLDYLKANKLTLNAILITHHHPDHCGGITELAHAFPGVSIYAPKDKRIDIVTHPVQNEDHIQLESYHFRVIEIPGHTSTHICFLEPSKQWLFCGDTLFSAGCGRVFDGTMKELHDSLQLIKNLPDDTEIYCGHEYTRKNLDFAALVEPDNESITDYRHYLKQHPHLVTLPSTLALEKKINPFLRTKSLHTFASQENLDVDNSLAVFTRLREKKDHF